MAIKTIKVKIRGKTETFPEDMSKADMARFLFADDTGYTVNEVSKAVPMAYSQALTIFNKMGLPARKPTASQQINARLGRTGRHFEGDLGPAANFDTPKKGKPYLKPAVHTAKHMIEGDLESIAKRDIPTARQLDKARKQKKTGVTARVGKLRTPGHSSDIDVGECANCGHDLVVRKGGPAGYMLIHVNITAEEYLAKTQFCIAVPEVLL